MCHHRNPPPNSNLSHWNPPPNFNPATEQSCNPSPIDPNSDLCHHQNSTTDADHHKPTPSTTPIHKLRPPPRRSLQAHALHLTMASRQHHMHRNPPKKMPKRETHWFERGAWGIWVWVWVWAKSRDKESSRRLSIKIMGERRKRRRKKEEKERMEAKKLRDWSREEKEKEKETHKHCWDRRVSESCDLKLWCYDLYWAWFFVFNFFSFS